eukprot:6755424-Pyramimonas_sp.AAC.1
MRVMHDALYSAGVYDRLNVGALASDGTLCRCIQIITDVRANPQKVTLEHAKPRMGTGTPEDP